MARRTFLDLGFDAIALDTALDWIAARNDDASFAYVVTPNVDHMVRLPTLPARLRQAYSAADLCLCDSRILAKLARSCGVELTVVPGSDLTARLLSDRLPPGTRLLLVGGHEGDERLLAARFPRLFIERYAAPMGLLRNEAARQDVIRHAAECDAAIILLAVGSPQQELLAAEMRENGHVGGTALCIGASVDFLVGREQRAPRFVQKLSLEWAWRMAQNPRRLMRRYLVDDPKIFLMAWRWRRRFDRDERSI